MTDGNQLIHSYAETEGYGGNYNGLTKREYFAAIAMSGLVATGKNVNVRQYARMSVSLADALIAELNNTQQP